VIFIKDYLEKTSTSIPTETPSEEADCSVLEFPDQTAQKDQGCSREEIGKLVDKLMSMPEPSGPGKGLLSDLYDIDEDPFLSVAARVLEEEIN